MICRVNTTPQYSFILVAFHADPHHLKEALALFEHSLRMVRVRYGDADIIVYADLNVQKSSSTGKKFFASLPASQWCVLGTPAATRIGYGNQKESTIDYFFVSNSVVHSASEMKISVESISFPSDHKPLQLKINFIEHGRQCAVRKTPSMLLDLKALDRNAKSLAFKLSSTLLNPFQVQQVVDEASGRGLPLKQRNNNFWAKFIMGLERRNLTWDTGLTVELMLEDYRQFLLSSFEDLSHGKCGEFYRKVKSATLLSTTSSFLDVNNAYLKG